jgi:phospholipid transport system substrate-binding protein
MKWIYVLVASLFFPLVVVAQEVAPDALVRNVTSEVLDIVRKDKEIQSGNTRKILDLVEAKVLPNFNFTRMTKLAVGKNWRQASSTQQSQLTDQFRTLLVRTYSKALTEYKSQEIVFKPFVMKAGETDVIVRSEIKQASGGKPIPMDYFLEKDGNTWRVYDIEVSGISLVTTYRDSFASEIRSGGIDALISSLQAKNKPAESLPAKK